jgi:hypothetical protein
MMLRVFAIIIPLLTIVRFLHEGYGLIKKRLLGFLFLNKYFSNFYLVNPSITEPQVGYPHLVLSS